MAIQHSRTITNLEVLNSGDTDVVCQVEVEFTSYDDSDQEGTTITSGQSFELATEDRSSSSDGWVAYADLTEETLLGWLGSELTDKETAIHANQTAWITSVLTPVVPSTVNKTLPW